MPDLMTFDEALAATDSQDRLLILGNGFSASYFSYGHLLDTTSLDAEAPVRRLFTALDTYDFERVMNALENAALVANSYGHADQATLYAVESAKLREALVNAIREIHPTSRADIEPSIPSCSSFLKKFGKIFTLNYDLLLYWVVQDNPSELKDGFGLGVTRGGFHGPFRDEAYCNVFNLHGALHLFRTQDQKVEKRISSRNGLVDAISRTIIDSKRLPIFVAEGTSEGKMGKINSVPYLRHCYEELMSAAGSAFIFGHSANQTDEHIYEALFGSDVKHIYFFVHRPTARLEEIKGEIARYKERFKSAIDINFVDAESAHVWG